MKDEILVSSAVLRDKRGRVLVCKLADKPGHPAALHWVFPGGKRDGEESMIETLVRETKEELGFDVSGKKIRFLTNLKGADSRYSIDYLLVSPIGYEEKEYITVCDREFVDFKWMTYIEVCKLDEPKSGHLEKVIDALMRPDAYPNINK